jgi:anthranilate synthase component I
MSVVAPSTGSVASGARPLLMRPLDRLPDLLALHQAAPRRFPCLLESLVDGGQRARYDLLLAADGRGLRLGADGVTQALGGTVCRGSFLDALDAAWSRERRHADERILPFQGGWALLLGYELVAQIEPRLRLPAPPARLPTALALRCPAAIVVDRHERIAWAVAEPGHEALLDALVDAAARTVGPGPADVPLWPHTLIEDPPQRFLDGIKRIKDYLAAGDAFQVNLSRGWQAEFEHQVDPGELYRRLRQANPAPFSGLLAWDDWTLLSSSPERLVSRRGERIETRPIAGTSPRRPGDDDARRIRELAAHPKERAEHIMLIDLERNDLGRICATGSVQVEELMAVESYAHVHHIESTVAGLARPGLTPGELIRAVFPGGTITGCPKVRCMEIIAELEGIGRGPYTGAMGWLDSSGDLDLNILIRSGWLQDRVLRLRAGAGIVVDSDPDTELAETRAKARGLLRALGCND